MVTQVFIHDKNLTFPKYYFKPIIEGDRSQLTQMHAFMPKDREKAPYKFSELPKVIEDLGDLGASGPNITYDEHPDEDEHYNRPWVYEMDELMGKPTKQFDYAAALAKTELEGYSDAPFSDCSWLDTTSGEREIFENYSDNENIWLKGSTVPKKKKSSKSKITPYQYEKHKK